MIDPHGNLWFVEGGANLITRISGRGRRRPRALPRPARPRRAGPAGGTRTPPVASTPRPGPEPPRPRLARDPAASDARARRAAWLARTRLGPRRPAHAAAARHDAAKASSAASASRPRTRAHHAGGVDDRGAIRRSSLRFSRGKVERVHARRRRAAQRARTAPAIGASRRELPHGARHARPRRARLPRRRRRSARRTPPTCGSPSGRPAR